LRLSNKSWSRRSLFLLGLLEVTEMLLLLVLHGCEGGGWDKDLIKWRARAGHARCVRGRDRVVYHDDSRIHVRAFHVNLRLLQKVDGRLYLSGRGRSLRNK